MSPTSAPGALELSPLFLDIQAPRSDALFSQDLSRIELVPSCSERGEGADCCLARRRSCTSKTRESKSRGTALPPTTFPQSPSHDMDDEEELLITLPELLSDPATTFSLKELRSPILADANPITLVRCLGDELSIREAEEAEEGWSTMAIWAIEFLARGR